MSSRAIQRLRRERQGDLLPPVADGDGSDEEDSSDEEDEHQPTKKSNVFAAAMFGDDSDSDSESDSSDDSDDDSTNDSDDDTSRNNAKDKDVGVTAEEEEPDTEDIDTLLQEYKLQDAGQEEIINAVDDDPSLTQYGIITSEMETRDLDVEYVRRSLLGGAEVGGGGARPSSRRSNRQHGLFVTPSDNWPRPPHYVGGGIGFRSYSDSEESSSLQQTLPWPYCDMKEGDARCPPLQNWFHFVHSDSYQRDYRDMKIIQDSGDPNAMLMFIAHHPYVVEALLQISIVMYQMNQGSEGLSFLKRALWIFECAASKSFLNVKERCAFMDYQRDGNESFFSTLFRLIRVSHVGGLTRSALAVSQFLLSLDPLRDPKNVLLSADHFALVCNTPASNRWVVDFVESKKVYVAFRDDESREEFECQIVDLPNWGYSYALALFNLHEDETESHTIKQANDALKIALCRFPSVFGLLLAKNDVDTNSRSLRTDWPTALKLLDELVLESQNRLYETYSHDSVLRARISQACDTIVQIFVQQSFKLWSSYVVLTWVYNNLMALQEERKNGKELKVEPVSPAIVRYLNVDPVDYEDKLQTMPADANPFDPNTVTYALNIDPNRRRLVQRNPRAANANAIANLLGDNGALFA